MKTALIVPTLNPGKQWQDWVNAVKRQSVAADEIVVVDSSSDDGTFENFAEPRARVHKILRSNFDHGGTRQLGVDLVPDAEILIFLTQDAILENKDAIKELLIAFDDPNVGVAYGRQLPRPGADLIEAHARIFNYGDADQTRDQDAIQQMGIKAAFCSNSFAAYRRTALESVGGFPIGNIFGEDMFVAAKMIKSGWKSAYRAKATAFHSHHYDYAQEFRRYFDIGVFHSRNPWLIEQFGRPVGEGKKFVISELKYLVRHNIFLVPSAVFRTFLKYAGYKLGQAEAKLPLKTKIFLGMNKVFWKKV